MRLFFILICIGLFKPLHAQRLLSFEPDSLGISGWSAMGGKIGVYNLKMIGIIPFTATDGNYFMVIENDSSAPVKIGSAAATVKVGETPQSLSYDFFYLPAQANQFGLLQYKFYTNGIETGKGYDTINPIFSAPDTLALKWNKRSVNLPAIPQKPDSCTIQWWVQSSLSAGERPLLFLDHMVWSKWKVGIDEAISASNPKIYPNPASKFFKLNVGNDVPVSVRISSISGHIVANWQNPEGNSLYDIQLLAPGLYFVECTDSRNKVSIVKLLVWK